ncbi:MAG: hypothetical protein B6U68_01500, partial [Candidatus Aenigmarchaeota archaeon ex4484_14]
QVTYDSSNVYKIIITDPVSKSPKPISVGVGESSSFIMTEVNCREHDIKNIIVEDKTCGTVYDEINGSYVAYQEC